MATSKRVAKARKPASKPSTKPPGSVRKKPTRMTASQTTAGKAPKSAGVTLKSIKLKFKLSKAVPVDYLARAHKFVQRNKIHTRRHIPQIALGEQISDAIPTPKLALAPARSLARESESASARATRAATDDVTLVQNIQLDDVATADTASHVGEPSCASNGKVVFYTGNWYAAVSLDGGTSFQFVNPATAFPDPPGMSFCCDQVVHYIKKIDTFVWLLQYSENPAGENIQRLALATTAELKQGQWRLFDISSQGLGLPGIFLDFPDLAVGSNMLYMTTNGFRGEDWEVTVLVRMPLAGIKSGSFTSQAVTSNTHFNFRIAQHCGTRAFWASHNTTSSLRLFFWDESKPQPSSVDVSVASWSRGPYISQTPDGRNWLGRADPRMVGATKKGSELWFAWCSGAGGANNRPQPFVQIARVNATTFQLIENINLWHPQSAIGYAALSTNTKSEVGVSYTLGGGGKFPTHVVGILTGTRKEVPTFTSTRGPNDQKWGDYLTVRRHSPNGRLFAATGYTLQSGAGSSDATPNFTLFGRSSDL
jgi:hypothetical protein